MTREEFLAFRALLEGRNNLVSLDLLSDSFRYRGRHPDLGFVVGPDRTHCKGVNMYYYWWEDGVVGYYDAAAEGVEIIMLTG